jgi:hypothetical protein
VTTAACQALLDYDDLTQDTRARVAAEEGGRFILEDLGWFECGGKPWLRYWPGRETPTINVQASAAALLTRLGLRDAADQAAEVALCTQRPDGSWPYSVDSRAQFIDGFHTGFTLQGLAEYATLGGRHRAAAAEAVERGFLYFAAHLLTPDGLPRSVADGRPGLDGQNVSQCIQTLVACGGPDDFKAAGRLWHAYVEPLLGGGGRFTALRWNVGPAVLATAYLLATPRILGRHSAESSA